MIGALLLGARWATDDGRLLGFGRDPIAVSAADVERLRRDWRAGTGREPTAAQLDAAIRTEADDEMLVREALRLGLDRTDPVVRARLVQNLRFARGEGDEGALLSEAAALDMSRHDLVARRRLAEAMRERLAGRVRIDDADVTAYRDAHPERYARPARIVFRQVFFSVDRHGASLERVARENAPQDGALPTARADGLQRGDPFLLGAEFPPSSESDIARAFGDAFAREAFALPAGRWSGPLRSAYGLHYLYVERRLAASPNDDPAVRRQAYYALLEERERDAARDAMVALRRHYPLQVEPFAVALATNGTPVLHD